MLLPVYLTAALRHVFPRTLPMTGACRNDAQHFLSADVITAFEIMNGMTIFPGNGRCLA